MGATIKLDGEDFAQGSAAHLRKIEEMHRAELAKSAEAHVRDVADRQDLLDRAARANAATRPCENRFRLLVNGVKDYAIVVSYSRVPHWRGRLRQAPTMDDPPRSWQEARR
jgi:hypothetical protein